MKINQLLIGLLIFGLFAYNGCEKDQQMNEEEYDICGVINPDWFMDLIEEIENDLYYAGSIIYSHEYNSDYLFHLEIPVSSCAYCRIYDCVGNLVELSSEAEFQDYLQNRSNETIIWHWEDQVLLYSHTICLIKAGKMISVDLIHFFQMNSQYNKNEDLQNV